MRAGRRFQLLAAAVLLPILGLLGLQFLGGDLVVLAVDRLLAGSDRWDGELGDATVDLARGRIELVGLRVQGAQPSVAVDEIFVERGWVRPQWKDGNLFLNGVAVRPRVVGRPSRGEQAAPAPVGRRTGLGLDVHILDGTWVWRDEEHGVEHVIDHAHGVVHGLGDLPRAAELSLSGLLPAGTPVRAHGLLDFWGAHGDAVDLRFDVVGAGPGDLDGVDTALFGVQLSRGKVDGSVRFTMDLASRDLAEPGACASREHALQPGCVVADLCGQQLELTGLSTAPLRADRLCVSGEGSVGEEGLRLWVEGRGVAADLHRSDWTGVATGAVRLPPLDLVRVDLHEVDLGLVDDAKQPPVRFGADGLEVVAAGLSTHRRELGTVRIRSTDVYGGTLQAMGSLGLYSWPPPTRIDLSLDEMELARVHGISAYLDARVERGRADLEAQLEILPDGTLDASTSVSAREVVARVGHWRAEATSAHVALFEGEARVQGLRLQGDRSTLVERLVAPTVSLRWDATALLEHQRLRGSVYASSPELWLQRVRKPGSLGTVEMPVDVDVHVESGTLRGSDPTVPGNPALWIDGVQLDVTGLGTPSAHWTLAGALRAGGAVEAVADYAPLSGQDVIDAQGRVVLTQVDLRGHASLPKSYLEGFPALEGKATVTLDRTGSSLTVGLDGEGLGMQHPRLEAASGRGRLTLTMADVHEPGQRSLTGELAAVDLVVRPGASTPKDIPPLPELVVPHLTVRDADVRLETPLGMERLHAAMLEVRQARTGSAGERGEVWVRGSIWDGELEARLHTDASGHRLELALEDGQLAQMDALAELVLLDPHDGTVSLRSDLTLDPAHDLDGSLHLELDRARLFSMDDLKNPPRAGRELLAGAAVRLLARDGVSTLDIDVSGTPDAPRLAVGEAYLKALFD